MGVGGGGEGLPPGKLMDTGNKKETTIEKKFLMEIPSLCGETEEFLPVFFLSKIKVLIQIKPYYCTYIYTVIHARKKR
jgi:hypothetical protein